jgi:hypothetical protein
MVAKFTLTVQLVTITIKVVSLIPTHGEVYSIQHFMIKLSVINVRSVILSGSRTEHEPMASGGASSENNGKIALCTEQFA